MKRVVIAIVALSASVMFAAAQPARESYEPGLGEFMTATQLRHAKLWFAGKQNNWDLAAYEIDEIKEGLEDAARLHPSFDGVPVAEMIKTRNYVNARSVVPRSQGAQRGRERTGALGGPEAPPRCRKDGGRWGGVDRRYRPALFFHSRRRPVRPDPPYRGQQISRHHKQQIPACCPPVSG
jgi:hypothetical protein